MIIDLQKHQNELFNPLIGKLQKADTRFVNNFGGAGSGKSFTQTQHEIIKCLQKPEKLLVTRKVASTLKDSVISLTTSILNSWGLQDYYTENKSTQFITFANGSQILFKGLDDSEKIKSIAGITRIWNEEASELSQSDFNQLNLRLRGRNGLQMTNTFNPIDEEHWIKKHFFDNPDVLQNCTNIHTTYKDNKFIDEDYKKVLEGYQFIDKNYYKIYCLGEWGGITEGRIFPIWEQIDELPQIEGDWYALDFGYSNDPTGIIKTIKWKGRIYFDERLYRTGMTNQDIAAFLKSDGYKGQVVICDSAEPKSIEELRILGINAVSAVKGPGSITAGIDFLKSHKILITKNSLNLIKENRYYQWRELPAIRQTATKRFDNVPKDWMNHLMDACRYAYSLGDFMGNNQSVEVDPNDL